MYSSNGINKLIFCLPVLMSLLTSCTENKNEQVYTKWTAEQSTEMNKQLSAEEQIDIQLFLARKPLWKMKETGSGLRYFVYETGNQEVRPKLNDKVEVEYKISLLNGTECYATKPDEVEEIHVDKAQIESGIQEAIKLLAQGDKAMLIIPSHLAHGLVGDLSKIPPLSTLVVDLTIYKVIPSNNEELR